MDFMEVFMNKNSSRSRLLPIVIIPVCGLLVLAICYAGYFAVYLLIESVFFSNDLTSVPAGIIRNGYTALLLAVYLIVFRKTISDLIKAIILFAAMTMVIIAVNLAFYLTPALAILSTLVIAICCTYLLYRYKKLGSITMLLPCQWWLQSSMPGQEGEGKHSQQFIRKSGAQRLL